jgi:hypothetical protein
MCLCSSNRKVALPVSHWLTPRSAQSHSPVWCKIAHQPIKSVQNVGASHLAKLCDIFIIIFQVSAHRDSCPHYPGNAQLANSPSSDDFTLDFCAPLMIFM